MNRIACAVILAACGDPVDLPDASTAVPAFEPGCVEAPQPGTDPFAHPADLGPITPGTLADWDPDGRWFLTGTSVGGVSSYHFERRGEHVIVDRDGDSPGTIDADVLYRRTRITTPSGKQFVLIQRVSDRAADGTLRAERALCDGETCRVCTARLERAAWHAGEQQAQGLALVGELHGAGWEPGFTLNVRVAGTLAYVIRRDGLRIIDTSDPANLIERGHYQRPGDTFPNDLKLVDAGGRRYAIIADTPVDVVDVTDPTAPRLAATVAEEAHTLAVEERGGRTLAYFGNYDATCPVYDVTDPALPVKVGSFATQGELVHDLSVENGVAYLAAWDAGLLAVDFDTPASPRLLGAWSPTPAGTSHSTYPTMVAGRRVLVHGDEGYGARLDVVDVDPASTTFMQPLGTYRTRDHVSIHNVMAFGTKAYVAYYQDGVRVIDLADPRAPRLAGYFNTWDPQGAASSSALFEGAVGIDVDLARGLVFVADSPRGLLVLRDDIR